MKNRFDPSTSILDAGCGGGRNLVYFLRNGFEVFAVDRNREAIRCARDLATALAPQLPVENFQASEVEAMPFSDERFDAVISSDEQLLAGATNRLGGTFLEPIKTTNVQNLRSMTTWVVGK